MRKILGNVERNQEKVAFWKRVRFRKEPGAHSER